MPFQNPIIAGDEIIYPVRVSGPSGSFDDLSAGLSFHYKGTELQDLLDAQPRGLVAYGSLTPGATSVLAETVIGYLDAPTVLGRRYRVWVNNLSDNTAGTKIEYRLRFTTDGSTPTTASAVMSSSWQLGQFESTMQSEVFPGLANSVTRKFALTAQGYTANAQVGFIGQIRLIVEDIGLDIPNTMTGAGGGTTKVYRTFDIQPIGTRSYNGAGAGLPYDNQYMMQGDAGVDGNRRSWAWFDQNSAGFGSAGSIANFAGIGAGDVVSIKLFLYYPHWYWGAGGTASLGYHNSTANLAATEPGGGTPNVIQVPGWQRNQGRWIDLVGSSIQTAMMAGTFKGFMLGNTGSADRIYYGYAYGANGVLGQCPGLKVAYYK